MSENLMKNSLICFGLSSFAEPSSPSADRNCTHLPDNNDTWIKSNLYWVLFPYPQKSIPNSYGLHLPIFLVTIWNIYCNVCNVCDLRSCQINSFCRWEGWNLPFATSLDTQWPYLDSTTCLPGQYEDQKHLHQLEVVEKVYLTRLVYCVNTQRRYTTIDTWHSHSGHWMNQLILFIFN